MKKFITRDQIKELKPIAGESFFVEAWDADVNIRKWSGKQRAMLLTRVSEVYGQDKVETMVAQGAEQIKMNTQDYPAMFKLMAEIVSISLCDESGVNLYDASKPEDVEEVENFDADLLQLLFEECAKRNGLLESQIKNEIKNSETTQNSDSILA
jgi:hypothetical protein